MKKIKKRIYVLPLLLAFLILFCACEKEKKTCEELLYAGLEYGIDGFSEDGYLFLGNAKEGSSFFISPKNWTDMYGKRFGWAREVVCDFAIYVSARTPYEMAIFECYSENDADEILQMCYERADEIKLGLRYSQWERASGGIEITVYKKHVIFAFTDSQARNIGVIEEIKELIE